jgi:hypothetical protein
MAMIGTIRCLQGSSITLRTRRRQRALISVAFPLVTCLHLAAGDAAGAIIQVTTTQQKISASGGCSLQEAIFSANLDNNVAIAGYSGSTPIEVTTQCVPGSGDDIIVLPAGALFQLTFRARHVQQEAEPWVS